MAQIDRVGLIGGGVIGSAWAARMMINGIDVTICDPDPEAERKTNEVLQNALRAYRKMTLAPLDNLGSLRITTSIEEACEGAQFIQESLPERIELKQKVLALVSAAAGPDVVIGSSTSGLLPTDMQRDCPYPDRVVVGHPFNPVYLMPLVEVCGGEKTSEDTKQRAAEFYKSIGMHPLILRKEVDAFLADRLMEAVWREALHLINDGIATTDEIDQALCYGPGLRWSFMGTFLVYRLAGGEAGMKHFLDQFGPTLKLPWTHLVGPEWTDELVETICRQSDDQAGDVSIRDFERLRDDCLVSVMQGLRSNNYAAGEVLKRYDKALHRRAFPSVQSADDDFSKPLRLYATRVDPAWVDHNGHLAEATYLRVFSDASGALFNYVGVNDSYRDSGLSYFTVETHITHSREAMVEQPIEVSTQILDLDDKRLHLMHVLHSAEDGGELATCEQMFLHVNLDQRRACDARGDVRGHLQRIFNGHARLPRPGAAGRSVGLNR
jgi:carnitine 3-dehydrogenase